MPGGTELKALTLHANCHLELELKTGNENSDLGFSGSDTKSVLPVQTEKQEISRGPLGETGLE